MAATAQALLRYATLVYSAVACGATFVAPDSPHVYFSEKNWFVNATHAVTVNSGAYVKVNFTGSSAFAIQLQPTNNGTKSTHYMNIVYSVNGRPYVQVPIYGNTSVIACSLSDSSQQSARSDVQGDAGTVQPPLNHPLSTRTFDTAAGGGGNTQEYSTVVLYIYNSLQSANRWSSPGQKGASLVVTGIELDAGATTVPYLLKPKRAVFFGDSITEGVNAECRNPDPACRGGDLCANAATKTWGPAVAAALSAEYSQIGFGSLGWVVGGAGGVPAFYDPGSEASSWNHVYENQTRNFDNIDYLFVGHATNDGLRGAKPAAVAASVQGWLKDARAATGPATNIFLCVPFGGFGGANAPKGSLKAGFDAYSQSAHDPKAYFIDLGREAALGLECGAWERGCVGAYGSRAGASVQGCDGIHPRGGTEGSARHGELGAMLATQAMLAMHGAQ